MSLSDSKVVCMGASHAAVPLDLLERLSLPQDQILAVLQGTADRAEGARTELVVLSTCNRTEIYTVSGGPGSTAARGGDSLDDVPPVLARYLQERSGLTRGELASALFRFDAGAAERHLFRVISGLDSLVVGETQIIGQVSRAYNAAQRAGTAGPTLSLLFESAIRTSRRTRIRSARGASAHGAAAMAVQRAEEHAGDLSRARVLVLGTGEMGRLVVPALRDRHVGSVEVLTRNPERAEILSARWGLAVRTPADLPELLAGIDVLISSTSSASPLVTEQMLSGAMSRRPGRPIVIVDLAVPRTVDRRAAFIPGVTLLDIESLRTPGTAGEGDDPAALAIIGEELAQLELRMAEVCLRPVIGGMWRKADRIREEVLATTRARVPQLDDAAWQHVENLTHALVAKILHDPSVRLRAQAANGHAREYAEALRHLFALSEPSEADKR
jgi:glutamyl-tRNA reductase